MCCLFVFFFSSRRRHTRCALVTGVQTCALPICRLALYVDGADECDPRKCLIKGGGAALTREKIIAEASDKFVCIIDPSKQVDVLGKFTLPVEVIPMAQIGRAHV